MRSRHTIQSAAMMLAALILGTALLCSCSPSIPEQMDSYVTSLEKKSKSFTKDEWKSSEEEFGKLVEAYTEERQSYSEDEKLKAVRAMGRYHALLIRHGIAEGAEYLNGYIRAIPEYLEGFFGPDGEGTNIVRQISEIIDSAKVGESIQNFGKELGTIIDDFLKKRN